MESGMNYTKVTDPDLLAQLNGAQPSKVTDPQLLSQLEGQKPAEQFLAPKEEGLGTTLPRDVMIGLLNQRQNVVNTPHDIIHGLETVNNIRKLLSFENYIGKNPPKPELTHPISKFLPNEHNDFAKLMGQEGTPSTGSWLIQK